MKIFFLAAFFSVQLVIRCAAGLWIPPEMPSHKLDIRQVASIFEGKIQSTRYTNYLVVSIDWAKASAFQPRGASAHYSPANDQPDEYSWFVTYAYKDAFIDQNLKQQGIRRQFNAINVMRIKDDGRIGVFIGVQ